MPARILQIKIKLYKAIDGKKEYSGILKSFEEDIILETEDGEMKFTFKEISKAHLCDFE